MTDLESALTHEAGHALGLAHSDDPNATMFSTTLPGETSLRTLEADDEAGICAVYPASSSLAACTGETASDPGKVCAAVVARRAPRDRGCSVAALRRPGHAWPVAVLLLPFALLRRRRAWRAMRSTAVLLVLCLVACTRTARSTHAEGTSGRGAVGESAASVDAGAPIELAGQGGSSAGMGGAGGSGSGGARAGDSMPCPSDPATPPGYHKLVVQIIPPVPGSVSTSPAGIDRCTGRDSFEGPGCDPDPSGPLCGCAAPACSASFAHGTAITLHARSEQGAVLHRWRGDCPDDGKRSNDVTIMLDRDMTCIAEFGQ
jgi:hypothetical protein